jgi:hypothetical protein
MPYKDPADKRDNQRRIMRERRAGERSGRRAARAITVVREPFSESSSVLSPTAEVAVGSGHPWGREQLTARSPTPSPI